TVTNIRSVHRNRPWSAAHDEQGQPIARAAVQVVPHDIAVDPCQIAFASVHFEIASLPISDGRGQAGQSLQPVGYNCLAPPAAGQEPLPDTGQHNKNESESNG